jgi:2,3-bisphosphoglycerate-independent phosphoglycerate mutase
MKYIIIALSGAADQPSEEVGAKTPLEVAKIPNLNALAKQGRVGQVRLSSDRLEPYPDVTLLNLLGYEADKVYTGRGPLEAANLELKLENNEVPFRLNFVTEFEGVLSDPEAGRISTKESRALINFLNKKLASDFVRFFPGTGYRHVVVIKDSHGYEALSAKTHCPHDIVGQPVAKFLPHGPGGESLKKLMYDAKLLLQDHEINLVRLDLKENPANLIWVWGQGRKPHLERFSEKVGCQGALVSDSEYAKGLARLIGLTVVDVKGGSDDLAVNYQEKARALFDELEEKNFVCVHLRECDEAGRWGDFRGKVSALEAADYYLVSRVKQYLENHEDVRVLLTPCHALPWQLRRRTKDWVPFAMVGKNIKADDSATFNELTAQASEFKINKSTELLSNFLSV